jgi:hypothetical protein
VQQLNPAPAQAHKVYKKQKVILIICSIFFIYFREIKTSVCQTKPHEYGWIVMILADIYPSWQKA